MAKSSISDQIGPWLAIFRKYYFWLLSAVVPLLLLPLLFIARGSMTSHINSMRQQIDGHVTALQGVTGIAEHPNESWSKGIEATTKEVSKETLKEWQSFWDSQKTFRSWPEETLGADFVSRAKSLKPDGKLPQQFRERYKDKVRMLVRELPVRMGVEPKMGDPSEVSTSRANARRPPARQPAMRPGLVSDDNAVESSPYMMEWSPENQQRIYMSFNWEKDVQPPSPARILLAQEELWVYEMFCDLLAGMNKSATGPHSAAIARVDELSVSYPAAEDDPGGGSGKRIVSVAAAAPRAVTPDDDSGGSSPASGVAVLVRPPIRDLPAGQPSSLLADRHRTMTTIRHRALHRRIPMTGFKTGFTSTSRESP